LIAAALSAKAVPQAPAGAAGLVFDVQAFVEVNNSKFSIESSQALWKRLAMLRPWSRRAESGDSPVRAYYVDPGLRHTSGRYGSGRAGI